MSKGFNQWDKEQNEGLENLPVCKECGKPIQDEYYYDVNGDTYCDECMDGFRKYNDDLW